MSHDRLGDFCGCPNKMAGEWGDHGFHWRLMGDRECFRRMEREDSTPSEGPPLCQRGMTEEECAEAGGCTYQGKAIAISRCLHWLRAVKENLRDSASGPDRRGERMSPGPRKA